MEKHTFTCRVLYEFEVEGRSVFQMAEGMTGPAIAGKGGGELTFLCGSCGRVLADSVGMGSLTGVVIRCACGAPNETDLA